MRAAPPPSALRRPSSGSGRDVLGGRPVRVVHVIKGLRRAGAEVLLAEGLRAADRGRFHLSYAYFVAAHDDVEADLRALGAAVHCFDTPGAAAMLASVGRVARHLRRVRADVVHAHLPLSGAVARLAGRAAGVPVVYTEHNVVEPYHPLTRLASRATWALQDRVLAVSPDVARSARRHGGRRVPVQVVTNGIDTDRFDRQRVDGGACRRALGVPPGALVVGAVAGFRRQKRLDVWLEAARRVRAEVPGAHFVLVGDGELRPDVERAVAEHGLGGAVRLVGVQDDVRPYLAAMDVFMVSSEYEGLPLAPLEAMSMGVPVVATDVAGVRGVVRPGEVGALVPFGGGAAGLASAVVGLARDPARRERQGRAARALAVGSYGLERMQRELEAVYLDVVGERSARSASGR